MDKQIPKFDRVIGDGQEGQVAIHWINLSENLDNEESLSIKANVNGRCSDA